MDIARFNFRTVISESISMYYYKYNSCQIRWFLNSTNYDRVLFARIRTAITAGNTQYYNLIIHTGMDL